jgi:hypothetical protein
MTKHSTISNADLLRMLTERVDELRTVLMPLAAPNLQELGRLHNSMCRAIRRELPGEADHEVLDALDSLRSELPSIIADQVADELGSLLNRVIGPFLPLLMQAVAEHPLVGQAVQAVLSNLQARASEHG